MTTTELDDVAQVLDVLTQFPETHREAVLVAHADPNTQAEVEHDLARRGYRVFTAGSGIEAVWEALAHAFELALLVCDARLKDVSPVELYRRLKLTLPGLRCCVLTGELTWPGEAAAVGMGVGVVHTLHAPVE